MTSTDADFGYPAWRGYVSWLHGQAFAREQFTADTGMQWPKPPRSAIEAMIDKAVGYEEKVLDAFVIWASEQYGVEHCPPDVQAAIAKKNSCA